MTSDLLSLLVLIVSGALFFLTSLTISAFGTRLNPLPAATKSQPSNGNGNGEEDHEDDNPVADRVSIEAGLVGRGAQAISIVAAALAIYSLLGTGLGDGSDGLRLALSGVFAILGGLALLLAASATSGYMRDKSRVISRPVATLLRLFSITPGIKQIVGFTLSRGRGDEAVDEDVSAAIQESLDFLEESVIPADQNELRMIRGILRMDTVRVREIMVPRVDMTMAPVDATLGEVADLMSIGGHSKVPVFRDNVDSIDGVIYARDVLAALDNDQDPQGPVHSLARSALHVPESQSLEKLLRQLQEHRTGLAIVVDEYGGVSGLVTVTDLIEEIVGELIDEFDVDGPEVENIGPREMTADAGASIDVMNQTMGTSVIPEGFDTVGGLVFKKLGKMPSPGDVVTVENLKITVQSVIGRRIRRVKIEIEDTGQVELSK